jgi:ABC-type transport system substrate-binding protein
MKRLPLVLAILCIMLLSLAPVPVRGQSNGSAVLAAEADSAAGDFVVALESDVTGLDAAVVQDAASLLVTTQIYDTLVVYRPSDSFPMPGLAQSWSVSADGLTGPSTCGQESAFMTALR